MLVFFQYFLAKLFFNASTRRMVLVGPRNLHHTLRGVVLILNERICGPGGRNTPTDLLLAVILTWMLAFFQIFFGNMFSNALLRRMVLVGPRNSHHTPRGFVLILNQRICGAGGEKYAFIVALSRHFDLDVGFLPNVFRPNIF